MKAKIFLGSPRKGGNTEILADEVAAGLREGGAEVEVIRLAGYKINPCIACGGCEKTGCCVVQDDMQAMYPRIDDADRLILVSPIYFYGVTAQLKAFIDRSQAMWSRKYLLKKRLPSNVPRIGCLVSAAATKGEKVFDGAVLTVQYALDAMDFQFGGSLLVKGVDRKGEVRNMDAELERARRFGRELAEK
jgi:multimeric flavodoxin WrbA